jgi:hypothetical protein
MYIDNLTRVCAAQAFAATAFSTNVIDLGLPPSGPTRAIGTGEGVGFGIAVGVAAFITSSDESYLFEAIQSVNADLSVGDVIATRNFTAAQAAAGALVAGTLIFLPIAPGTPTKQFLGLRATLAGTTPAITITAWLTHKDLFSILALAYRKGYTIS